MMKILNNKVGLLIGKGRETIKNMQAQTGAWFQVIPWHLPLVDTLTERILQNDGTSEKIDCAKQLFNQVISDVFSICIYICWIWLWLASYLPCPKSITLEIQSFHCIMYMSNHTIGWLCLLKLNVLGQLSQTFCDKQNSFGQIASMSLICH